MKKLIGSINLISKNGQYRIHQFNDGNAMPQVEMVKVENNIEVRVKNVYGELKKLNDELLLKIDCSPSHRKHPLNTREFADQLIKRYQKS